MFFRDSYSKKSPTPVLQLVQNKRQGDKVSQELIVSLAGMSIEKPLRRSIAKRVENLLQGQESLFETPAEIDKPANYIVQKIRREGKWDHARRVKKIKTPDSSREEVFVDEIEHTDSCELGPELVAYAMWQRLKFDEILTANGFNGIERKTAAVNIFNRLIEPTSENNLGNWLKNTGLPEIMPIGVKEISKSRYYRVADKLIAAQTAIEESLAKEERNLFNLERSIYLYDLTNTYFEGEQKGNEKAQYSGNSKEKRNDCPQVAIGLTVDGEGFPLGHKVFEGNRSDSSTLEEVIEELKEKSGTEKPTVIVDSGMSKEEHLKTIRAAGLDYIVNQKRTIRVNYPEIFENDNLFKELEHRENKTAVSIYKQEFDDYVLLFCKSEGRANKENAIKNKAHEKIQKDLEKLRQRIKKGKLINKEKINQAIGRLKERHARVARFYTITCDQAKKQLCFDQQSDEDIFAGCYILKSSRKDLKDAELWHLYMTLTKVERAFRYLKSNLGLRPNRHQKEERVDSHIFITILAYHLLRVIEYTLEQQEDFRSWPTIKQQLETHCYATLLIPTTKGPVINVRKAGLPNAEQKLIYQKLNVNYKGLPKKKIYA